MNPALRAISILILLGSSLPLWGQIEIDPTLLRNEGAKKFLRKGEIFRALNLILSDLEEKPNDPGLNYYAGLIFEEAGLYEKALPYFQYTVELNPRIDPRIRVRLGNCLVRNEEFEDAVFEYEKAIKRFTEGSRNYQELQNAISQGKRGSEASEDPLPFQIVPLPTLVNTRYPDYCTALSDNGTMIFCSRRPQKSFKGYFKKNGGYYFPEDLPENFFEVQGRDTNWTGLITSPGENFPGRNPSGWYNGPDNRFAEYLKGRNGDVLELAQWQTDRKKTKQKGKPGSRVMRRSCMVYGMNGYFVIYESDKPGGQGGTDLFYATRDAEGNWSRGENLGPDINTDGDDRFPSLGQDGKTLYFSSNSPSGFGGYDLYACKMLPDGSWSAAERMGWPINGPADDLFYTEYKEDAFYISSNRKGTNGDFDIFYGFRSEAAAIKTEITGMITDKADGAAIPAILVFKDLKTQQADTLQFHPSDGMYNFRALKSRQYKLTVRADGYFGLSEVITVRSNGRLVGHDEIFSLKRDPLQQLVLEGVIRDSTSGEPLKAFLDIVEQETNVLAGSIETDSETGLYRIPVKPGVKYKVLAASARHKTKLVRIEIPENPDHTLIEGDIVMANAMMGKKFILQDIYFDQSSSKLSAQSLPELDKLAQQLEENPRMKIEIGGHTDNTGALEFNMELSEARAEAVKAYLVSRGIQSFRLKTKGYGHLQPIGNNETEEGRRMNRRTEFRILDY